MGPNGQCVSPNAEDATMSRSKVVTAMLIAAACLGCEQAAAPADPLVPASQPAFARSANAPVHQVSAGGQVDYSAIPGFGDYHETYGFHASVDGNGNVTGEFQSHWGNDASAIKLRIDISCLSVNGNQAWLGGTVTQSGDETAIPVGMQFVWSVIDGGEGKNAPPDRLSYFYYGTNLTAAACANQGANFYFFDWTQGNVQVR